MTKKDKTPKIQTDYFKIDGYDYSITFIPNDSKKNYQIMNEHTYKIHKKGEVE